MITDPQVIKFTNDEVRPLADLFYRLYYKAKSINADYNAGNIGTLINNSGAGGTIIDGSQTDGRTQLTGGDIYNIATLVGDFIVFVEAGRLDIITKPHVNGI